MVRIIKRLIPYFNTFISAYSFARTKTSFQELVLVILSAEGTLVNIQSFRFLNCAFLYRKAKKDFFSLWLFHV
ncbi:hypothetical protein CW304_21805 [Bacillus sp. UFRGS-B20]|nr:hypothetical protein CW304_21805 [Bacillus sp. UFRGS-B20]